MIISTYTNIMTKDINKSVHWYVTNFDFKVIMQTEDFALLEIAQGRPFFINRVAEEVKRYQYTNGTKHADVGFHAGDIEKIHERLLANGTEIVEVEEHEAGWTTIYLYDPDENYIEVWSGGFGMNNLQYMYKE